MAVVLKSFETASHKSHDVTHYLPVDEIDTLFIGNDNSCSGCVLAPSGLVYLLGPVVLILNPEKKVVVARVPLGTTPNQGAIARNGNIYMGVMNDTRLPVLRTSDNSVYFLNHGTAAMDWAWAGVVVARNGNVYYVPFNSDVFLCIDPSTDVITRYNMPSGMTGIMKFIGGVCNTNGKLYFIPYGLKKVMIVETENGNAASSFALSLNTHAFSNGQLAPNGKIYCSSHNGKILVIDTSNDTHSYINCATGLYQGAILGFDGCVYFVPLSKIASVMKLDLSTHVPKYIKNVSSGFGENPFQNGILTHQGVIVLAPYQSQYIMFIKSGFQMINPIYLDTFFNRN